MNLLDYFTLSEKPLTVRRYFRMKELLNGMRRVVLKLYEENEIMSSHFSSMRAEIEYEEKELNEQFGKYLDSRKDLFLQNEKAHVKSVARQRGRHNTIKKIANIMDQYDLPYKAEKDRKNNYKSIDVDYDFCEHYCSWYRYYATAIPLNTLKNANRETALNYGHSFSGDGHYANWNID